MFGLGGFALIISRKGHEEGGDHGRCFLLTCHWQSILRALPEAGMDQEWVGCQQPYKQQAWGKLPAQGISMARLPKFLLQAGVLQGTVCFQHAKLALVPTLHME